MIIGSVLLQPHKVAAPPAPSPSALLEDVLALASRILVDQTHGGHCLKLIEGAFVKALENLRDGIKGGEQAAVQKLRAWIQPLSERLNTLGHSMPGDSAAQEAIQSGDLIIGLLIDLLQGVTTDELSKHLNFALKILHDDLGITSAFIDIQIRKIFDEIVKQLRSAPLEADLTVRENRFEIIALVQRIRRDIEGKFTLPEINVDRLAAPLLDRLRDYKYDDNVKRAANVGKTIQSGLNLAGVISDEVTFSMGFSGGPGAAGAGSPASKRCWYASWVTGYETRDPDPAHCPALAPYSFKKVDAADFEKVTLHMTWPTTLIDGILVSLLGYSKGRGVYSITTTSLIRDSIYTVMAPLGDINLPTALNYPLANATGQTFGNLVPWFDKLYNVVCASLCCLEGRALNRYDFFLYVLRFIFRIGGSSLPIDMIRDTILSIITLANHDPSIAPTPLNRNHDGLIQFFMQIVGPLIHAAILPDNFFSINGEYGSLIAAVLLGGLGFSVLTFGLGLLLSTGIAGEGPEAGAAAKAWVKGWLLSIPTFIGLWFTFEDGSTKGGKRGYTPDGARGTEVEFAGYAPNTNSPYLMPFVGAAECIQGNHGFWSHNSVIGQIFSYDFSLNIGQDVLCMRDGEVWGVPLDSVDDGEHPDDGNHIIIKHTTPAPDHDKDVAGAATVTYAKYYHGKKDSIKDAFGGTLPAAGTPVAQGRVVMACNSTGMSRCNHIHIQVNPDNGGSPAGYTIPWVYKDAPDDGVPKSGKVYDSQNVKKP